MMGTPNQTASRRRFLRATAAGTAWLAWSGPLATRMAAQSPESRVDILLNEPVGTIAPEIYGHFVEHLGGVVYDGIWVGEGSRIPNVNGLRKQLVEGLKRVKPGMIRWPGGCFADQYDWRDGTGPRDKRPKRTNFWVDAGEWPKDARRDGPERYDPNLFGTVEFARFCKQVGAQPYFAANLRSLPAQEFWRWVEYCNSPANATTLGALRAADGETEALGVRYWGVGNESWGCGGNFDPEDYGSEFNRYTAWGAILRSADRAGGIGSQRWQCGLDAAFLRQAPQGRHAGTAMGLGHAPLRLECQRRAHHRLVHWQARRGEVRRGAVLRDSARSRRNGIADRRALGGDGGERPAPPHQAGGGRVGWVVRERHGTIPRSADRPTEHHARCGAGRPHAGYFQPARRQDRHGGRGPVGELPAIAVPGARRQILPHAGLSRLRHVRGASGSPLGDAPRTCRRRDRSA